MANLFNDIYLNFIYKASFLKGRKKTVGITHLPKKNYLRSIYSKMEICRVNFREQLPLIMESIEQADFIAIDTEFSGCSSSLEEEASEYDTNEEQY